MQDNKATSAALTGALEVSKLNVYHITFSKILVL